MKLSTAIAIAFAAIVASLAAVDAVPVWDCYCMFDQYYMN
jgi:hypothetical protein